MSADASENGRGRVHREAGGIVILALALFSLLSLASYEPGERATTDAAPANPELEAIYRLTAPADGDEAASSPSGNLCGSVGRVLAASLIGTMGAAAFLLVALVTFWAIALLVTRRFEAPATRLLGAVLLLAAFATAATFLRFRDQGGWVGAFFYSEMQARFSRPGSTILIGSAMLIGLLLTTDFLPLTAFWKLVRLARKPAAAAESSLREVPFSEIAGKATTLLAGAAGAVVRIPSRIRIPIRRREEEPPKKRKTGTGKRSKPASAAAGGGGAQKATPAATRQKAPVARPVADTTEPPRKKAPKPQARRPAAPKPAAASRGGDNGAKRKGVRAFIGGGIVPGMSRRSERGTKVPKGPAPARERNGILLPPVDLLSPPDVPDPEGMDHSIREITTALEETLRNFKVEGEVVEIDRGPVITLYEVELAAGIKVQKVVNLADDLAMALKNPVRIVAPIPGKSTVGIEVPNRVRETVSVGELSQCDQFQRSLHQIPFILGKDASGNPVVEDLAQMPHMLIAGATGSGKSICINTIILSILLSRTSDEIQMILIDPKMVELSMFKKIPHLLTPVVTDMKRAPAILDWAVAKMEERYALLADMGVKNITGFNDLGEKRVRARAKEMDADPESVPTQLPYILIIVDELADLMMIASKEIENSLTRLAQKSRAVGIHIIFATQRPSVDVITGLIKANFPARISFRVSSRVDSRTILDTIGAEKLLGSGDLLYLPPRSANLLRCQGAYVSEKEIKNVVSYLRKESEPQFNPELENLEQQSAGPSGKKSKRDALYDEAVRFVLETNRGSVSLLQRRFEIGYSRAARLIDQMADNGVVGRYKGSKAREVLVTLEEWEASKE